MYTNVQIKQALDDKMMKTTHSSPFDFFSCVPSIPFKAQTKFHAPMCFFFLIIFSFLLIKEIGF